jgi:hypothetical protein
MDKDKLRARLIEAGFLPDMVDDAIAAADKANHELPTLLDAIKDSEITERDKELARQFWLYSDSVPQEFKRLLSAVKRL